MVVRGVIEDGLDKVKLVGVLVSSALASEN